MKIKSNVLFGLIVLIFSISGFSLLKRLTRDVDEWRPSDLYSTTNVSRRSTYSVVSSGASASYSGAVPSVSSGASSVFRHRGVSSYAPVVSSPAYSFSPLASSPLASSPQGGLYATSSAEFRSFGGGGNAGGVFMSGGTVKSSGSSMASASGLSISMPNASMYAFAGQGANNNIPVVSGDAAMAAMTSASSYTTAYSGIGRTTAGGAFRGLGGRRESNGAIFNSWWNWLSRNNYEGNGVSDGNGNWIYTYDKYDLQSLYNDFVAYWSKNFGSDDIPGYDEWLEWYISTTGSDGYSYKNNTYLFQPIGGALPLIVMALIYLCCTVLRRKMKEQI